MPGALWLLISPVRAAAVTDVAFTTETKRIHN